MRKFVTALLLLVAVGFASAGNITDKGWTQLDLYTFLSNIVTMSNSEKSELNLLRTKCANHPLDYMSFDKGAHGTTAFSVGVSSYGAASYPAYVIANVMYQFSGSSTISLATTTGIAAQASTTDCLYLIEADSSGNIYCTKGTSVTAVTGTPVWPAASTTLCVVGGFKLGLGNATGAFTVGTTGWGDLTNSTFTAYQLFYPPSGTSAPSAVSTTDLTLTGL